MLAAENQKEETATTRAGETPARDAQAGRVNNPATAALASAVAAPQPAEVSELALQSVVIQSALSAALPGLQTVAVDSVAVPVRLSRFSVGLLAGAMLTNFQKGASARPVDQLERTAVGGEGQWFAQLDLTPRLSLRGGLGYAVYRANQRLQITTHEMPLTQVTQYTPRTVGGQPDTLTTLVWIPVPSDSSRQQHTVHASVAVHYLTVPLQLEWRGPVCRRWQWVVGAGPVAQFYWRGRSLTESATSGYAAHDWTGEEIPPFRKISWALNATRGRGLSAGVGLVAAGAAHLYAAAGIGHGGGPARPRWV